MTTIIGILILCSIHLSSQESSCNVTSPPDNGHFTHIRKTVTLAEVGCNKGYHLSGSNYSVCKNGPEIADDPLFGSSPVCISDSVTGSTLSPAPSELVFYTEASCSVTSPPDNDHLSHVRKTITLAKVICNEGYHISVGNYLVCDGDQEIESDALFGSSTMCIPDDVTSTRPALPSDTTKLSLITPTNEPKDDMREWYAHEECKNWKIVIIIESVLLAISLVVNAVAIVRCVKLQFSQSNTPRDEHQSTEEERRLNTEQGETSM